jgi:hypothetical protein
MYYLSDDPTYLAGGLALLGLIFLIMLWATQQGKYLIYGGAALGLALLVVVIERVWVTDNERIEDTVYALAKAVEASDGEKAAEFLTPDCRLEPSTDTENMVVRYISNRFAGPVSRERLIDELSHVKFDYLKIVALRANAGKISGRGTAEFAALAMGTPGIMTPPAGMGWSLGLREVQPGVWKVSRITPGRLPNGGR